MTTVRPFNIKNSSVRANKKARITYIGSFIPIFPPEKIPKRRAA